MLLWLIQQVIVSLVVIVLIHSIYKFLQNNLTTPKIRDLVNKPTKEYDEIYKTINGSEIVTTATGETISSSSMKNELQNYLKELNSTDSQTVPQNNIAPSTPTPENTVIEGGSFSNNFGSTYQTF